MIVVELIKQIRRPLLAVAGGVGLTIISRVFNADYLPGVSVVDKYMPNNDIDLWNYLFVVSLDFCIAFVNQFVAIIKFMELDFLFLVSVAKEVTE